MQGEEFDMACGAGGAVLCEVRATTPDLGDGGGAVHLNPCFRTGEGIEEAGGVGGPIAEVKIEITLSDVWAGRGRGVGVEVWGIGGLFTGEVGDEGWRPGFAAVAGVGYFEVVGVGSDVGPDAAREDGFAIDVV